MKKILSIFLCLIMAFSIVPIIGIVASADTGDATGVAQDERLPMIFVTGVGQTFSYIEDEEGEDVYHYKYLDENGEYQEREVRYNERSNIISFYGKYAIQNLLSHPVGLAKSLVAVVQIVKSLFTGTYDVDYDNLCALADELLYLNILDEDNKLPDELVTPFFTYPVSDYNEDAWGRFNRTVPYEEGIRDYGADHVFCFNYVPFGSVNNLAAKLNDYIHNVQTKYFPGKKVILVPMSMGAVTVSRYLDLYGDQGDVAKVISVVGCWGGSDVFADLVEGKYADDSAEIFYSQLVEGFDMGDATTSLINIIFHCFSKDTLSPLIRDVVNALRDEVILKSPTLVALIPSDRYDAIREEYLTRPGYERVLAEADAYHETQSKVKETIQELNEECGTEFYFISGYDLAFGEVTPDYKFFDCFASSDTTNSDEIITIDSTTVGATYVTANTEFSEAYIAAAVEAGTDKYISPDKSIDLSTAAFPDHCFAFCKQKHELEDNNVALQIILGIAKGEIEDVNTDPNYPQFNQGRNLYYYKRYYEKANAVINDIVINEEKDPRTYSEALGDNYADLKAEAEALIVEGDAMTATTIIDPEADAVVIEKFKAFNDEVDLIVNGELEKDFKYYAGPVLKFANDAIYFVTGPKGIPDLFK